MMEEYKNQENAKLDENLQDNAITLPTPESTDQDVNVDAADKQHEPDIAIMKAETSLNISPADKASVHPTPRVRDVGSKDGNSSKCLSEASVSSATPLAHTSTVETAAIDTLFNTSLPEFTLSSSSEVNNIQTNLPTPSSDRSASPNEESNLEEFISAPAVSATAEKSETTPGATSAVNPATQESVYKTITKRLSLLEANATLSLRYIEEQSQLLRDVFGRMERRHGQKMESFLSELNSTLVSRLRLFVQIPS
jgi:hypothetical protein